MKPEYIVIQCNENKIYVRESVIPLLSEVDVIVFDCDGVLLDVQKQYRQAAAWTTCAIVKAFTGVTLPMALFDDGLNFAYKRTGGMNNDWDLTYALAMRVLASSPETCEINRLARRSMGLDLPQRLKYIGENSVEACIPVGGLRGELLSFAASLDDTGVEAVDGRLLPGMADVKRALGHPGGVGESIVSTMFEEVFGGAALFEEAFGIPARLTDAERGYVDEGRVEVVEQTIDRLEEIIGGSRFGVASGSPSNTARHLLGSILDRFKPEAQVWLEDVKEEENRLGRVDLGKPNPYSLTRSAEAYHPYKRALYVGDTVADMLMAERVGGRYLFMGVYGCAASSEAAREAFMEAGCGIVAQSVNDLPAALRVGGAR